jgi:D-3-phosphoglycerate dehydrogenase / 2-oxoglutarate reductase
VQLEHNITLFRYRDVPGMIGRVGTVFGAHGVNIVSAAVGRQPEDLADGDARLAAMAVTTDVPVPAAVIDEIVAGDGFVAGRTVSL